MSQADELLNTISENGIDHEHAVTDSDSCFIIDPKTRAIENTTGRQISIMQFDHNSERLTFELPRIIEGHDMSLCNVVKVHYNNIDGKTGTENADLVDLYDLQVNPENEETVICSWLISRYATQLAGTLNFLIQYLCVDDEGNETYEWHTDIYRDIEVKEGRNNGPASIKNYTDILEQWRVRIFNGEISGGIQSIEQTTKSTEDGGVNEITVTLMNGNATVFEIQNGSKGDTGNSGVYVGSGDMPEDCNVQIDPDGEADNSLVRRDEFEQLLEQTVNHGIYVGDIQPTNGVMYWLDTSGDSTGEDTGGDDTGGGEDSGGDTEVTLSSISAVYTGGNVTVGTELTALTGITVTGTYSDGSTTTITGYTLSGTIAEGTNTITVTYSGLTTTFMVTGVAETEEVDADELICESNIVLSGHYIDKNAMYNFYQLTAKDGSNVYEIPVEAGITYAASVINSNQYGTPYWSAQALDAVNANIDFSISSDKLVDFETIGTRVSHTFDGNTTVNTEMTKVTNDDGTYTRSVTFTPAISGYLYVDSRVLSQTYSIKKVVA